MTSPVILIVDDEPQNLAALRQILADEYRLIFARDADQALRTAHQFIPALILLDVRMPGTDGFEACRRLKANPRTHQIPVVFVTSLSDVGDEVRGFEAGAVDYIIKPFSAAVVLVRVRTHISLVRSTLLEQSYRDAVQMLGAAGHYNDTDTGVHIWRMAAFAGALARRIGWDSEACEQLELAAPMHDTGKIGIPNAIIRKPGPLDADEWVIMRTHSQIGHSILSKSNSPVFRVAAEIALHHHEKWGGGGYPNGLAGETIPESARIVALADVFDALSTKRPYKEAWPVERVVDTIREGAGSHFEPRLLDTFLTMLPDILSIKAEWDTREQPAPVS